MKKKECPACAMEVEEANSLCPVCGYEFAETNRGWVKWLALILLLVILFFWIF